LTFDGTAYEGEDVDLKFQGEDDTQFYYVLNCRVGDKYVQIPFRYTRQQVQ